jgi:hypothetical protein
LFGTVPPSSWTVPGCLRVEPFCVGGTEISVELPLDFRELQKPPPRLPSAAARGQEGRQEHLAVIGQ